MVSDGPRAPDPAQHLAATLGLVAAVVLFAGNFVAARHGLLAGMNRFDLASFRAGVPGLLLLPYALGGGLRRVRLRRALVLTVLGGVPFFLLTVLGVTYAPASHAVVLSPAMTTIAGTGFSRLLLGRRPSRLTLLGIAIMLAGLAAIAGEGLAASGRLVWLGDTLLALGGSSWGLFAVLLQRWRVRALDATSVVGVLSLPLIAAGVLLTGSVPRDASAGEWVFQIIFQGLLVGAAGTLLFSRGVAVLGSATAALFPPLVPVFGTGLAALVLGETVTLLRLLGIVAVIAGMLVAAVLARRAEGLRLNPA